MERRSRGTKNGLEHRQEGAIHDDCNVDGIPPANAAGQQSQHQGSRRFPTRSTMVTPVTGDESTQQVPVIVAAVVMLSLSIITVSLRFYTRGRFFLGIAGAEDWTILVALVWSLERRDPLSQPTSVVIRAHSRHARSSLPESPSDTSDVSKSSTPRFRSRNSPLRLAASVISNLGPTQKHTSPSVATSGWPPRMKCSIITW